MAPDRNHRDATDGSAQGGATTTKSLLRFRGAAKPLSHIPSMSDENGNFSPATALGNSGRTGSDQSGMSAFRQLSKQLFYFPTQRPASDPNLSGSRWLRQTQNQIIWRQIWAGIPKYFSSNPFQQIPLNRLARQLFSDHYTQSSATDLNRFG